MCLEIVKHCSDVNFYYFCHGETTGGTVEEGINLGVNNKVSGGDMRYFSTHRCSDPAGKREGMKMMAKCTALHSD